MLFALAWKKGWKLRLFLRVDTLLFAHLTAVKIKQRFYPAFNIVRYPAMVFFPPDVFFPFTTELFYYKIHLYCSRKQLINLSLGVQKAFNSINQWCSNHAEQEAINKGDQVNRKLLIKGRADLQRLNSIFAGEHLAIQLHFHYGNAKM